MRCEWIAPWCDAIEKSLIVSVGRLLKTKLMNIELAMRPQRIAAPANVAIYQSALFLILIFSFLFFNLAQARADSFSLGIFPPIIEITAKPPANVSTPLSIQNLSSEAVELNIIFKPFTAKDSENGQVLYQNDNKQLPPLQITMNSEPITSVSLAPKQKKELTLNINIPRDTQSADYYFSIIFARSAPPAGGSGQETKDHSGTEILGGLATNVLLSVGSTGIASGVIQEFSSPLFLEKGPVPFTVRVKNTGNHFIAPKGEIIIRNLLGEEVDRVNLLPVNVLAGSVRSIPSDTFDTSDTFAYWNEKFVLGPYRATLNLALSENGPLFKQELIFFAFPGITILAILGSLIVLLYLVSRIKRKI